MKYRKKQVVIEAKQWRGNNFNEIWHFTGEDKCFNDNLKPTEIIIITREGAMRADKYDWIIKGVKGEFYPCNPDIFKETYEKL